jgi:hypothetical protein
MIEINFYKQYTKCNLLALLIALFIKSPFLNTIVLINSLAICLSYHSGIFLVYDVYKTIHEPLTRYQWEIYNFIGHVLPVLICVLLNLRYDLGIFAGFISLLCHIIWVWQIHGTYVLDNTYIKLEPETWADMWVIAITTHIVAGMFLVSMKKIKLK